MEGWLVYATEKSILLIDAMALVIIVAGTVEAFVSGLRFLFDTIATNHDRRAIWLRYGRWLVAGLTFQLAADIIETSIAPDWDDVGRLAAIAAIRTLLNFFLERDLEDVRVRQREAVERPSQ